MRLDDGQTGKISMTDKELADYQDEVLHLITHHYAIKATSRVSINLCQITLNTEGIIDL